MKFVHRKNNYHYINCAGAVTELACEEALAGRV